MKDSATIKKYARKIVQYVIGLFILALGIVLTKKANLGMSAISTVPAVLSNIIPAFTLGNMTIAFHFVSIITLVIIVKKVELKTLAMIPLAIVFGYIIDMYMSLITFGEMHYVFRIVLCIAGTIVSALGIVTVVGANLMLPGPDGLMQAISEKFEIPLSKVKISGDAIFVATTVIIELVAYQKITLVGIGTLLSVLFTGRFVGILKKAVPWITVSKPNV